MDGQQIALEAGDVLAFPFGSPHQLGAGLDGGTLAPVKDLPAKSWREVRVPRPPERAEPNSVVQGCNCEIPHRPLRSDSSGLRRTAARYANMRVKLRAPADSPCQS